MGGQKTPKNGHFAQIDPGRVQNAHFAQIDPGRVQNAHFARNRPPEGSKMPILPEIDPRRGPKWPFCPKSTPEGSKMAILPEIAPKPSHRLVNQRRARFGRPSHRVQPVGLATTLCRSPKILGRVGVAACPDTGW